MAASTKPFRAKSGRLEVYEASNGFYALDTVTGVTQGMGDGVDMFTDREGHALPVGSRAFYTALRTAVRRDKWEMMAAYFGVTREQALRERTRGFRRLMHGEVQEG